MSGIRSWEDLRKRWEDPACIVRMPGVETVKEKYKKRNVYGFSRFDEKI